MSQEHVAEDERQRELLRKVHEALDLLEARLDALAPLKPTRVVDLLLQLRREVTAEFAHVERGQEVEGGAPRR